MKIKRKYKWNTGNWMTSLKSKKASANHLFIRAFVERLKQGNYNMEGVQRRWQGMEGDRLKLEEVEGRKSFLPKEIFPMVHYIIILFFRLTRIQLH